MIKILPLAFLMIRVGSTSLLLQPLIVIYEWIMLYHASGAFLVFNGNKKAKVRVNSHCY